MCNDDDDWRCDALLIYSDDGSFYSVLFSVCAIMETCFVEWHASDVECVCVYVCVVCFVFYYKDG